MRNLKVFIAYDGSGYHGFQRQENAVTVQQMVEEAIGKLLKIPPPPINGCSRTDAGVHARRFCFNVFTNSKIPCEGFEKGMNSILPSDIAVLSCEEAPEEFNARYCTKEKEYVYLVSMQRDVFLRNFAYHCRYDINLERMKRAAGLFIGEHDFGAFCRAEGKKRVRSTVRRIYSLEVGERGGLIEIKVRGNGFLYNMVRIISGTLLYVGEGRMAPEDIAEALEKKDRTLAGITLPACGLYLNEVIY